MFKKLLNNYKFDFVFVILLFLIAIISHFEWFRFGNILFSGDIWYWYPEALKEAPLSAAWISNGGFGVPNIQLYKLLFIALWSFLGKIGLQFTDVLRITHLIPIAVLGFLSPYVLVRYLTKEKFIAFVGALFYGSTTPFIIRQYNGHLSIAFIIALTPFLLYLFLLALEKNTLRQWFIFILVYWVGICYDPRIMYIVTIVLGIYFLFFGVSSLKKYGPRILASVALLVGLSVFWIFSVILGGYSDAIGDVAGRGLFGNAHYAIIRSFALFEPYWTGSEPLIFNLQPILWYFWIIPILTTLSLLLQPDKKKKKIIIFFSIIWLLGLFFTKQVGAPFPDAFQWLRENIPGFLVFRSGSKFWFVLSLGCMGLLSYGLLWLKNKWDRGLGRLVFASIAAIIIILSLWNLKPLIFGKFGGMLTEREIPNGYILLKEYLGRQEGFFRTFWTPADSTWGIYTNEKPKISNAAVIGSEWKNYASFNPGYDNLPTNEKIAEIFKIKGANELFDNSSVKYVIVPIRDFANDNDFFIYYGGKDNPNIRDWYISELDKIDWLKKIDIGTNELVVYENEKYKPPLFAFNKLYNLNSFANLDKKYSFITNQLNKDFYFTVSSTTGQNLPLTQINSLFENISQVNIDNSTLKVAVNQTNSDNNNDLYAKADSGNVYVAYQNNQITFYSQNKGNLFLNDIEISQNTGKKNIIKSIPAAAGRKYYALVDNQSLVINRGDELDLGVSDHDRTVELSITAKNIIPNPSFENGLWQKKVWDCHNYDNNPVIAMKLNQEEKSNGAQSLQLEATRHMACTVIKIPITESGEYMLTFDYQSPNSDKAGYYLNFNDDKKTVIKNSLPIVDDKWQTYTQKIIIPKGATVGTLYLYAYAKDNVTSYINRYDNFKLERLLKLESVVLPAAKVFNKIPVTLQNEKNIFEYKNEGYDYKNIISNHSFENGLWQGKVGDCHNYDKNPVIAMKLSQEEKSDGAQSLQLEATRHIACTVINLPVKSGRNYLLSFDYQSPNASIMSYYIGFNDSNKAVIKENVPINNMEWNKFTKSIIVPGGATQLSLYLYAKPIDEKENIINRYDNFQLIENPNLSDVYYLVSEPKNELKDPAAVNFDLINPSKKLAHIKGATTPFYLAMSESYHPQWQLQFNNDKIKGALASWVPFVKPDRVGDEYHYKLNDFLNAWYVDPAELCQNNSACVKNSDGSYDMEMVIEFWPQRWFYFGLLISGITLFGCVGYLVIYFLRRKIWRKNSE
jgi:hypothetical protein